MKFIDETLLIVKFYFCHDALNRASPQLLLVLWYKEGHNSPIYTFDARGKNSLAEAVHFSHQGRPELRIVPKLMLVA